MSRIGTSGLGSYWEEGGYVSWTALYETADDAAAAFTVLISEHQGIDGWSMDRVGSSPYGDEGVTLDGAAYGFDANMLRVWRLDNLILAAGAFGVTAQDDQALAWWESIAEGMNARAVGIQGHEAP